ncbi:HAD family hydrolase [Pseudobacteriovorax antillogorgiicola]|uniref:FMN phosphatase YigB, HAD superfamily n=1 Tax=Pseudobacteriovorax antillogorgiicola TaxID=1513793 RepID=A0A1Y6CBL9_9BACT|nr:HAD family hydrolase [Pseudobacteriovorax antillogorgiicola]TCS48588.1 hypothetical protein EDD56_11710 [Pseudobacteriovorax antillogorgiicola]SMF55656.1 hypothetical protein SAMN06296036_117149 [Pseudobacteriovorax antillogorgiicola]
MIDPKASIESKIEQVQSKGDLALVIFDIDDTIIDCRHRKLKVFRDFCSQDQIQDQFRQESEIVLNANIQDIAYRVTDCMKNLGIKSIDFVEQLATFWVGNYFTYPYIKDDLPFPGAESFVQGCHNAGAHIVYLTGRDEPGMGRGTREILAKLDFPWKNDDTSLFMKPDPAMDDFSYKKAVLNDIAKLGTVVASFENELKNLNQMAAHFPEALMYWRNTLYLPDPPEPHPKVETLSHFPKVIS